MNLYRKIALGLLQILSPFLTDQAFLRTKYLIKFNHWPDLVNPKLFNEKIIWRILYDRQPRFQQISDKLALRDYVKEKGLEHYLPRQYYVTDDPSTIDFEDLPNAFVIKPNHAWGLIHIVYQKQMLNQEKIVRLCKKWLRTDPSKNTREWQYKNIPRKIIVEEFLRGDKSIAPEYKFYCFDGEPQLVIVVLDRFTPQVKHGRFDLDWSPLIFEGSPPVTSQIQMPDRLDELVEAARLFSAGFDFLRVDLYLLPDRIVLGELTPTPYAGFGGLSIEHQAYLGELWNLNTDRESSSV